MTYEQIRYETRGEVALVTLHRPEKLNAWTPRMAVEMADAFRAANVRAPTCRTRSSLHAKRPASVPLEELQEDQ